MTRAELWADPQVKSLREQLKSKRPEPVEPPKPNTQLLCPDCGTVLRSPMGCGS